MKKSALLAEKCNCNSLSLSHFVNIVYSCFLIMHCIVSYCVLCIYLICYLYTIVLTKVTRNKDIYTDLVKAQALNLEHLTISHIKL
jgi:hypothetical protein